MLVPTLLHLSKKVSSRKKTIKCDFVISQKGVQRTLFPNAGVTVYSSSVFIILFVYGGKVVLVE